MKKERIYNYPNMYDAHMIHVPFKKKLPVLDGNYAYRDLSMKGKLNRFFVYASMNLAGFPLMSLLVGLKITNKKNLKKHKELLKGGAVTICNHVHMWDTICVHKAIRPRRTWHPGWAVNFTGPNRNMIKGIGGMPVPDNIAGMRKLLKTMDEVLEEGCFVHFFPEASMWFYYDAIRPFKLGAFTLALKNNKPILPMVINYRKPKGLMKLFTGNKPCLTLNVGEPVLPNLTLPKRQAEEDLLNRSREAMQKLSGFTKIINQNNQTQEDTANQIN